MKTWHPEEIELLKIERFQKHRPTAQIQIEALLQIALGSSLEETAKDYNRATAMIQTWVEIYEEEGLHYLLQQTHTIPPEPIHSSTKATDFDAVESIAMNLKAQKELLTENITLLAGLNEAERSFITTAIPNTANQQKNPEGLNLQVSQKIQILIKELALLAQKQANLLE